MKRQRGNFQGSWDCRCTCSPPHSCQTLRKRDKWGSALGQASSSEDACELRWEVAWEKALELG
eukprot:CAMPEP_0194483674 /NCGR_PEP_ID=MMETSP0253-20130528/5209_1 /TAXON_ID=2966 /ORGANISM="Noctiluca scintillans" /LENGTH=62 /DNA_ID=CAMNT_0039323353 /DNA_START=68 /DNA_END=252 /DNA_ORIENTATION=-